MSPSSKTFSRQDWSWFLLIWALGAGSLLFRSLTSTSAGPLFVDTDDAMRMVMVRDFLAGQPWYDLVQHRLDTPFGGEIHWSRLIDLPLAVLLALAQTFASPSEALIVAGTLWPLLLLGVLLWLSGRIATELVGNSALLPALVLPLLSPAVLAEFSPGRVDHHNIVMVLTLALLLASILALRRSSAAWLAGLLAATALAIAIESLPVVIAAVLGLGLAYVFDQNQSQALRRFGLSFAFFTTIHLMLARPPRRWLEAACDMISPVFAFAALVVGAAFMLVSLVPPPPRPWQRMALLGALGAAAAALVVALYPQCLDGPYGNLDPWLQQHWIGNIVEAKPWHRSVVDLPAYSLVVGIPVLLGLLGAIVACLRNSERRLGWLILLTFIVATALVMLVQVRGARLAILPVVPAASWLIVLTAQWFRRKPAVLSALSLLTTCIVFSGVVLSLLVNGVLSRLPDTRAGVVSTARASKLPCLASDAFIDLRGLPPERIMTPIDLGAHLLLETPHAVVAAPYHRNGEAILDAFRFLNRPQAEARQIALERGLGLFVTCPAMPEMQGAGLRQPDTVLSLLAAGTPPDWLEDVSIDGPLKVYAILP